MAGIRRRPGPGSDRPDVSVLEGARVSETPARARPDAPATVRFRDIRRSSWLYVLRRTGRGFWRHQCLDLAAGLTYHAVLAVVPALIALVSLLAVLGAGESSAETALVVARLLVPQEALAVVEPLVAGLAEVSSRVVALVAGVVLAVWFVTAYVLAVGRALNRIYEVREGRSLLPRIGRAVALTLLLGTLVLLSAVLLLVSSPVADLLGQLLGVQSPVVSVFVVLKWPVLALALAVIIALLYARAPNVAQPRLRLVSPGAVVAIVVWLVGSLLFGVYVSDVATYDRTYGSVAGLIVLLVWLWVTNLALLLGAELDVEVERVRQLEAGIPAEERVQLPVRDRRLSDRVAARDRADLAAGRRIREGGDETPG